MCMVVGVQVCHHICNPVQCPLQPPAAAFVVVICVRAFRALAALPVRRTAPVFSVLHRCSCNVCHVGAAGGSGNAPH